MNKTPSNKRRIEARDGTIIRGTRVGAYLQGYKAGKGGESNLINPYLARLGMGEKSSGYRGGFVNAWEKGWADGKEILDLLEMGRTP